MAEAKNAIGNSRSMRNDVRLFILRSKTVLSSLKNTPLGQVFIHLRHPMQASAFSNTTCLCKKKPVFCLLLVSDIFPHIPNMPCISVGSLRHTQLLFFSSPLFFSAKLSGLARKGYGQNEAILGLFKVSCPECAWAYTCRLCKYACVRNRHSHLYQGCWTLLLWHNPYGQANVWLAISVHFLYRR